MSIVSAILEKGAEKDFLEKALKKLEFACDGTTSLYEKCAANRLVNEIRTNFSIAQESRNNDLFEALVQKLRGIYLDRRNPIPPADKWNLLYSLVDDTNRVRFQVETDRQACHAFQSEKSDNVQIWINRHF